MVPSQFPLIIVWESEWLSRYSDCLTSWTAEEPLLNSQKEKKKILKSFQTGSVEPLSERQSDAAVKLTTIHQPILRIREPLPLYQHMSSWNVE
jgi:hypothetical protein